MFIDTHAHLTMTEFDDLDLVVERAKSANVGRIINAGFDLDSSLKAAVLASKYPSMYAAAGIHPHHADQVDDAMLNELRTIAQNKKVVAIGETGLDYFENPVPVDVQRGAFKKHLELAAELGLPVILHGRDADDDMLDVIIGQGSGKLKGVFHCFAGDPAYAKKVLDLGFLISFTGVITFKNAHKAREAVKYVPLDRMMIETDCPYLAPQQYRGKRNEPAYVALVAQKVAEVKGLDIGLVELATFKNAANLFKLE